VFCTCIAVFVPVDPFAAAVKAHVFSVDKHAPAQRVGVPDEGFLVVVAVGAHILGYDLGAAVGKPKFGGHGGVIEEPALLAQGEGVGPVGFWLIGVLVRWSI
jgi:hypothetical protein